MRAVSCHVDKGTLTTPRGEQRGAQLVGRIVSHKESRLGMMERTLETVAGMQRLQGDRACNRQ